MLALASTEGLKCPMPATAALPPACARAAAPPRASSQVRRRGPRHRRRAAGMAERPRPIPCRPGWLDGWYFTERDGAQRPSSAAATAAAALLAEQQRATATPTGRTRPRTRAQHYSRSTDPAGGLGHHYCRLTPPVASFRASRRAPPAPQAQVVRRQRPRARLHAHARRLVRARDFHLEQLGRKGLFYAMVRFVVVASLLAGHLLAHLSPLPGHRREHEAVGRRRVRGRRQVEGAGRPCAERRPARSERPTRHQGR